MPRSGPTSELIGHSLDLAFDARAKLAYGKGVAGMQLELIQLGLLAVTFRGELFVTEEGVVGHAVRIHLERLAALRPSQVPWLRTHREGIGLFRTGLERPSATSGS
jgi:hypothetical protein